MNEDNVQRHGDKALASIRTALERFGADHPGAEVHAYRYNSVSVRIRILYHGFRGLSAEQRENMVWPYLHALDLETQNDISMLLLMTEEELQDPLAFASREFDHPSPSML